MSVEQNIHEFPGPILEKGTRVELIAPTPLLKLKSALGSIIKPDEWFGYYLVRLDKPATYYDAERKRRRLRIISESRDNLALVQQPENPTSSPDNL
jgi:hypothetical protein